MSGDRGVIGIVIDYGYVRDIVVVIVGMVFKYCFIGCSPFA